MRAPCRHSYVRGMTEIANIGSSTTLQARPSSAAWLRIMALVYDPFVWLGEMAGMRRRRNTLVGGAYGRVIEIGAELAELASLAEERAEAVLVPPPLGDELVAPFPFEIAPLADEDRRDLQLLPDHAEVRP